MRRGAAIMIAARSPLRLSLGGGGTDLPSYYRKRGGFLIAGALDRHVTVWLGNEGDNLSGTEIAPDNDMLRAAVQELGVGSAPARISSAAELPAGSGLGSSGSFITALVAALAARAGRTLSTAEIATFACSIEIDRLGRAVGKQDQCAAAHGGLNCYHFHPDHSVTVEPLAMPPGARTRLAESCLLFFTGATRSAATVLADQDHRTKVQDSAMIENLDQVKAIGFESRRLLERGAIAEYGTMMGHHWELKKRRSAGTSTPLADEAYDLARRNGALGGKLVGAGGGGFLLLVAEDPARVRRAMAETGLREARFGFAMEGTRVIAP